MKKVNKKTAKVVVYTYGVFDLFHRGHVQLLKDAKKLGDHLVVGVFTDEVAAAFKRLPIISLADRVHMLKHCVFVDQVVIQKELAPDKNIKRIKPHILAKGPGAGWGETKEAPGEVVINKHGGRAVKLKYHKGISTSEIIKKIKQK